MVANVQSMFSVKERPWHGIGTVLPERINSAEAIVAAGLDWEVESRPSYYYKKDGNLTKCRKGKSIIRLDNEVELGHVGSRWEPVQNRVAFDFFDSVVGKGEAMYETAGALGDGERIWIMAKLPGEVVIQNCPEDRTDKFLLFSNSHDGSCAIRMFFTPVRVVCQNTLNWALNVRRKDEGIKLRHTKNVHDKVNEAQRALGLAVKFYDELGPVYNTLAQTRATDKGVRAYFENLYPVPEETRTNKRAVENAHSRLGDLTRDYRESPTCNLPGIEGTWWSAYNAVTYRVDHKTNHRGRTEEEKAQGRFKSLWFGGGAVVKRKALDLAVTMAASA